MHKTKAELHGLIVDLRTKKDFEKEIQARYTQFDGLLDTDTIAYLIVDELGRNKHYVTKIAQLAPDGDYTVVGKVLSISDSKSFKRKNGTAGKVVNLDIADDTGACQLVLWNGDIGHIKNKEIRPGSVIKVINGYTKQGYRGGIEINLGRWGLLEIEQPQHQADQGTQTIAAEEITGVLVHKESTRAFFRDDGEFGFVTTIMVREQNMTKEIKLWDQCVKDIQPYKVGDHVVLRNVTQKWDNGRTELHVSQKKSIEKRT